MTSSALNIAEIQRWAGWAAPWFMCGGTAVYIIKKDLEINVVPWLVWTAAVGIAAFNTIYVERSLSVQSSTFLLLTFMYPAVILRHRKKLIFAALPAWQKAVLPLLIASPAISMFGAPFWGILAQVTFSSITAAAFCQTALRGQSKESVLGWAIETTGGGLLALAVFQNFPQSLYAISSFLISISCLASILIGRHGGAPPALQVAGQDPSPPRKEDGKMLRRDLMGYGGPCGSP